MAGETSIQDAHMKENLLKYAVPASIVSAGLYSFVLSHCWYGICDKRKEQEKEDEEAPRNEPAVTVVCSLLEAVCLYHLSRATPGKKEGVMTTWMEVSVLGTLLLVSSHLMQNSIASLRPPGGLQLYHVGFDVARITGSSALLLGIEHALADLSDAPAPSAGHA